MKVPRGFKEVRQGSIIAIVRDDIVSPLDLVNPDHELEGTKYAGRTRISAVREITLDGSRLLVRRATRGGLLGRALPDIFWGRCRPFRELVAAERARERGIPTAEVVAAVRRTVCGPFYRAAVYTKEITGSVDLLSYLKGRSTGYERQMLRDTRDTLRHVGRVVRSAHDIGLYHADLQLKNVLVRPGTPGEIVIIDLDKARWRRHLPERLRVMNLLRLRRSAAKAARSGSCITRTDMLRFLKGYMGEDGSERLRLYWRAPFLKPLYELKWRLSDALYRLGRTGV